VDDLASLPSQSEFGTLSDDRDHLAITQRSSRTRYLPPSSTSSSETQGVPKYRETSQRLAPNEALRILFRLAIDTADAENLGDLIELGLTALQQGTPAEVMAVLVREASGEVTPRGTRWAAHQPKTRNYVLPSQALLNDVVASGQAILAEEAKDCKRSHLDGHVSSVLCAPLEVNQETIGFVHLYTIDARIHLNGDDLEFALAVARQLGIAWKKTSEKAVLAVENQMLKDQLRLQSELVGMSPPLKQVEQDIARVADTKATVLVRGESGVGKELVARAIHLNSSRKDKPFVTLNCAALTETLLERELFGHEKGAFTGATERVIGKFEAADRGTIFLDEIGEMSTSTQAKLLRVLEGQPFERLGGNTPIKVDVRVVAATNRPLEDAVREGSFRSDLYFRLQVVQIDVPPLRERAADIPLLAEHFLKKFVLETGRKIRGISLEAMAKLTAYRWPGNVRELRNVMERAVALGTGPTLSDKDIWLSPLLETPTTSTAEYSPKSLQEMEAQHIRETLEHTAWNKSRAAEILGIERSTLDRKIKSYKIQK
jgi:Nif-specific regulatory protein